MFITEYPDLFNPLLFVLSTPLIGCLFLFFMTNARNIKNFTLLISIMTFLASILMYSQFDPLSLDFQFCWKSNWIGIYNIYFIVGLDGISLLFILLTTFLIPLCLLTSYSAIKKNIKQYYYLFLLLELFLLLIFSSLDLCFFYIFFESVLIPMFLLVGIWGSRERKVRAAYFLFIYTLFGSLLMLLAIISIYKSVGTTDYIRLASVEFLPFHQKVYWLCFFASFAVKIPMLPFHIWLPEAHVEAPTAGSVVLAGILLKLGSYGFLRFSIPLFPLATLYFTPFVCTLAVIGIIYTSLTAIRQTDMKRVIAYASVAHMNLIVLGMFSLTLEGVEGSILQMLSHGLVASGLFLCVGVLYDRYHSRLISNYSGLAHRMPLFACIFLLYTLANIALPGTSSFIGEFLILIGIFSFNTTFAFLGATGMVLGGAYSLWLYNRIVFGNLQTASLRVYSDISSREFYIHVPLIINVFIMGLYPNIFLDVMHTSVLHITWLF